jgi:hypothetical protein
MHVNKASRKTWLSLSTVAIFAVSAAGLSSVASAADMKVSLSGEQEVPAVKSGGAGSGTINVGADKSISGSVVTTGLAGTAAHIHEAAAGKNGAVVIALTKDGDTYSVPSGTKLSDAQLESLKAGNLYINVHTTANPNGEIRAQLKP